MTSSRVSSITNVSRVVAGQSTQLQRKSVGTGPENSLKTNIYVVNVNYNLANELAAIALLLQALFPFFPTTV